MAKKPSTYLIGDIHGCIRTFNSLIFKTLDVKKSDRVFLLGDYIDRGPDSAGVIEALIDMKERGYGVFPLTGNHEVMLLEAFVNPDFAKQWAMNGGRAAMESWKKSDPKDIPRRHVKFIKGLEYFYELDDFVIVHAGLNFSAPDPLHDLDSMVWIRNDTVVKDKIGGRRIIVGHTPTTPDEITRSLRTDRIRLDGGCVYSKRRPEYGFLTALRLEDMKLFFEKNIDF